jgi:hypothetical protein
MVKQANDRNFWKRAKALDLQSGDARLHGRKRHWFGAAGDAAAILTLAGRL